MQLSNTYANTYYTFNEEKWIIVIPSARCGDAIIHTAAVLRKVYAIADRCAWAWQVIGGQFSPWDSTVAIWFGGTVCSPSFWTSDSSLSVHIFLSFDSILKLSAYVT